MTEKTINYILGRLVSDVNGCLIWPGTRDNTGYGTIVRNRQTFRVHRMVYQYFRGDVPGDKVIDHLCHNRLCANVDHMEVVDVRTNTLRGNGCFALCARATHCPRGHEYAGENLYVRDGKYRGCRACGKIRRAAGYLRRKAQRESGETPLHRVKKAKQPGKSTGKKHTIYHILKRLTVEEDGCWLWTGPVNRKGYARARCEGRTGQVHQHAYEHFIGPVLPGLVLDHICRKPACANPYHLEPVTHRENILRGEGLAAKEARLTHCPAGHPYAGENLMHNKRGGRYCRTCNRERARAQAARDRSK